MGGSAPVAANTTPAGRQRNRRTEITLTPAAGDAVSANGQQ